EWVHVQLHQQKGMISLSPPTICNSADGRFYRSRLALVTVYASPSPFSDERPSSRFRGISSPSKRRRLRYSTVGLTRYRTR
ncbi:hypothetical protein AB2484_26265, partial [Klebsiella pneumoniae]